MNKKFAMIMCSSFRGPNVKYCFLMLLFFFVSFLAFAQSNGGGQWHNQLKKGTSDDIVSYSGNNYLEVIR